MNSKFKFVIMTVSAVSFMIACNKKSDNGGAVTQQPPPVSTCVVGQIPPAGYICQNGVLVPSAIGGTTIATLAFESTYMTGSLMVNAQGPLNAPVYQGQNNVYAYNGQVAFGGTMQVQNTICINGTGIPGTYNIQGTGTLSNGILSGVTLTAVGPSTLNFQNPTVIMYNDFSRVGITGYVSLNGAICGSVSTY